MKQVKVMTLTRKGNDYGFTIPAGTTSNDIDFALATMLVSLEKREKDLGGDMNIDGYLKRIGELCKCIKQGL